MRTRTRSKVYVKIAPAHFFGGRAASLFFVALAGSLLFLSVLRPGALQETRMGLTDLVSPLMQMAAEPFRQAVGTVRGVTGLAELQAENIRLKSENARLREWYQTALILKAENAALQDMLNIKKEPGHKYITARTIADSGNSYVQTILVAAGAQDGLKKNQAVMAGEGMIGRVVETGRRTARILLLNDISSRVPVMVEGGQQRAMLTGTNERYPVLRHLPPGSAVDSGMRVVTSGHGGLFPPGLPVGRVEPGPGGQLLVVPFANAGAAGYVRIVDASINPHLQRGILDVTQ